ncbi:MAG: RNA pseudouridine synthase [Bacteroidota bacterium]
MLEILHETKDYIVVNKPSGLITEKNIYEDSLENRVYVYLQKVKKNPFVGVVHRLDRVTSGIVLFAKKKSALKYFNTQLEKKTIKKTYLAITGGKSEKPKGTLSHFLEKDLKNKKAKIYKTKVPDSKACLLFYNIIRKTEGLNLVEVKPQTGRFHQIRAQLSFIGLPIFGDEKYGSNDEYFSNEVCLHAWKLKFRDFDSGEVLELDAKVPAKNPWEVFEL